MIQYFDRKTLISAKKCPGKKVIAIVIKIEMVYKNFAMKNFNF